MRYDSFHNKEVATAAIGKRKLLSITELPTSPYHTLKNYGVVFIKDTIYIDDNTLDKFMSYSDSVRQKFKNSFTGLAL